MLSSFRQVVSRPSYCLRFLSTADSPAVSAAETAAILGRVAAHNVQASSSSRNITEATPPAEPVYLKMSRLIPPQESLPDDDQIIELDPSIFDHPIRRDIIHLCVVHHLDSLRQGSANTKTRGEVRGSGAKIRPQKGTGRARLGDGQSPMLRGGGVAFGPKPRDFGTKLPRKVIQMGMRVALSARLRERGLGVVPSLEWPGTKTREFATRLQELNWQRTLFVSGLDKVPENLSRVSSNLHKIETTTAKDLTVYDAVKFSRLILDLEAVEWFERALGRPAPPPAVTPL